MTLPSPVLDDLTWADMMAAIRRRIPAESGGMWTLHAPSDPGVTLLELFAYLLEQRLYWLDQVPDALVVAILRLLGLDPPRPAQPATTVLQLTSDVGLVPKGTVFSRDPTRLITFTVDEDVSVFPLDGEVTVWTDRDRTADLRARHGVPLFATDGHPADVRFTLPFTGVMSTDGWLSLLFEVDTEVPAQWLPGAAHNIPPAAKLTWSFFRPDGENTGQFAEVEDGTGGFRRSGIVRLKPPPNWSTEDKGLRVSTEAATFSAPPRLLQVAVNVSTARNRETRSVSPEDLAGQMSTWLKLPGQHLVLPDAEDRLLEATLKLDGKPWTQVQDFTFGASADRIFRLDRAEGALVFGDGLTGRIPQRTKDAEVEYVLGGGRAGNGGTTANWVCADLPVAAANLVQAEGGADPETVAEARERAAGALGEVTRAVTAEDYETLAVTTPGVDVARAFAALGEHPGFPCSNVPGAVTVHIVPSVPSDIVLAPEPDPGMLCEVTKRLDGARLLTAEVFVRPPKYRPVTLTVDLSGSPADRNRVSTVVADALRRYLDPLTGGEDQTGWPFGEALRPSALVRAAQKALGDLADVASVAISLDGTFESCADVPLKPGELPMLRQVRTTVVPAVEPGEGLT
ncbi:putative baseplate assembly protein [Actinocrispum sp. NPDC049592]|uniref:putative baseplate assembly protein n=1 Tax=Actinocrispum sp. NPDC049592 TaxID=3154835 RepID=UPI00342E80FA